MKCPKCGYLGFERVDRCRNCQYDFSLSSTIPEPDFTIRREPDGDMQPLEDLSLIDAAAEWSRRGPLPDGAQDLDRMFGAPEIETDRALNAVEPASVAAVAEPPAAAPAPAAPSRRAAAAARAVARTAASAPPEVPREDLPLFGPPIPDDEPLIKRASAPRQPLAVRRATPEVARLRPDPQPRTPTFDLMLDVSEPHAAPAVLPAQRVSLEEPQLYADTQDAGVGARLLAVLVDLAILAVIDAVVIYFTMQLCYLTIDDLGILPKGPLIAFLFVQNGGYLVAFTAGGQTLGKMVAGIRVVPDAEGTLDLGRAFLRTLMWVALAVPAGLGFLTALFSRDHRGLHDRFAGTRVVRASAWSHASRAGHRHGVRRRLRADCARHLRIRRRALAVVVAAGLDTRPGRGDRRDFRGRFVGRERRRAPLRPHRPRASRRRTR